MARFGLTILLTLVHWGYAFGAEAKWLGSPSAPARPRYEVNLELNEFSMLNNAIISGMQRQGGRFDFNLSIAWETNQVAWKVGTENPRLFPFLQGWVAQETFNAVKAMDPDQMSQQAPVLKALRGLAVKLEQSTNPVWDEYKIAGVLSEEGTNLWVTGKTNRVRTVPSEPASEPYRRSLGKAIIAYGHHKKADELELTRWFVKPTNRLDVITMSHCPFGNQALAGILKHLDKAENPPRLQVRYIFYKDPKGTNEFTALHGPVEFEENIIQMSVRNNYPAAFHKFLAARITDLKRPWEEAAVESGLNQEEIGIVKSVATEQGRSMAAGEYAIVTGQHGVFDGSPRFFWEGEPVQDLRQVPAFKELPQEALPAGGCSNQ